MYPLHQVEAAHGSASAAALLSPEVEVITTPDSPLPVGRSNARLSQSELDTDYQSLHCPLSRCIAAGSQHACGNACVSSTLCASTADVLTMAFVRGSVRADIVEIKHIMLPPSPREFKDIYVVFELMETDLHQVSLLATAAVVCMVQGQSHRTLQCLAVGLRHQASMADSRASRPRSCCFPLRVSQRRACQLTPPTGTDPSQHLVGHEIQGVAQLWEESRRPASRSDLVFCAACR